MQSFTSSSFIVLLLLVHQGSMDGGDGGIGGGYSSDPLLSLPVVEISGPKNFVALGGNNLTIRYRLSPLAYNLSTPFASLLSPTIQLFWLPEEGPAKFVASQDPPSSVISLAWQEVLFECGLIVRGGYYSIRLVERQGDNSRRREVEYDSAVNNDYDYLKSSSSSGGGGGGEEIIIISNVTIRVQYPVIDFEVPHRLETYTRYNPSVSVSFGLTRSLCKAKLPLPSTQMTLSMCTRKDGGDLCSGNFLTLLRDPLKSLQSEGRVKVDINCHFWGKNATYRVQIEELDTGLVIAKSAPIRVEWSPRYSLNLTMASVLPCPSGKFVRVLVGYPDCILPEKDKVRLYGYDTPVPSLLAIKRLNYIGEKQIRRNEQILEFSCNLFTPRFSRYCFQYISTAVDDSVSVVVETCIPTFSPSKFADGGWGPWSEWSPCSSTCGPKQGKQFRYRFCDSPQPAFGANFCQGDSIEERLCDSPIPECSSSGEEAAGILGDNIGSKNKNNNNNIILSTEEEINGAGVAGVPAAGVALETVHSFGFIPLHAQLNMNLSTTFGCECGCILDNIQPGINYSLVVIISSNQSSCGDQDEEDHHHLKWVLNAKEDRSRIRIDVVDVDLHCMKLAFRDGNTSDSNLLDVFTSSVAGAAAAAATSSSSPSTGLASLVKEDGIVSASRAKLEEQIVERQEGVDAEDQDDIEDEGHEGMTIRVESTGASLSIAASDSNQHDCTFQFLYLVAYYQATVPTPIPEKSHHIREWIAYDFWTFLLLKLVLSFFVVGVLCSTFGGCATKVYKKYKYKQLKWTDNDEDRILTDDGDDHGRGDVSRCTSVTLMSFDHSYWKRLRLLRLKYFLLKPKPLNRKIARIKSYPTTPTHHHAHPNNNNNLLTDGVGDAGACGSGSSSSGNKVKSTVVESCAMPNEKMMTMMLLANKQQSLSESELERKCNKFVSAHQRRTTTAHKIGCPANRKDVSSINDGHRDHGSDEDDDDDDDEVTHWSPSHYIIQDMSKTRGFSDAEEVEGVGGAADEEQGEKYKLITRVQPPPPPTTTIISNKASSVSVRKGRPAFISVTMPEQEQGRGINAKSRKEQENFKRRQWSEEEQKSLGGSSSSGCSGSSRKKKFARKLQQNNYNCQQAPSSTEEVAMKLILQQQRDKGKSQISVATIHSLARLSSSGEMTDSQDRVDMDDADHDFEMDYYDYDVLNAGNIPGSYLGLEPAFVLWNSEMYPDKEDGEEDDEEEEEEEEEEDSSFIQEIPSSELNGGSSSETFSISNNYCLSKSPSYSSPLPLHNNSQSSQQRTTQRGVRESSLQTLKFVDDDDDVDDIDEFEDFHDDRDTQVTLLSDKNRSGCPV